MKTSPTRRNAHHVTRAAMALALAAVATSSHANVGAKVILQGWEPWNDNRQPTMVPIDDPKFISGPIQAAWDRAFAIPFCALLTEVVRQPNLAARGVTLYNVGCKINMAELRLVPISQNRAKIIGTAAGSHMAATATTPNLRQLGVSLPIIGGLGVGSGADPRFAISLDAHAEIDVEIGDAPRPFLTVHGVKFNLHKADARGVNITGKVAEWVASRVIPFFGGPNFERMAEEHVNAVHGKFTNQARDILRPVNARIASYAQHVRVATWMSNGRIAIAMQPRNLPIIRTGGEMRGAVAGSRTRIGEPGRPVDCAGFRVTASYQVAPAPILNPDTLALGPAKRVPVSTPAEIRSHQDGTCTFALRGLALGMTNYVHASHATERARVHGNLMSASVKLEPSGWDGARVNPRPVDANRNYVLVTKFAASAGVEAIRNAPVSRIDPVITESPTRLRAGGSAGTAAIRALEQAALNPQPLPPQIGTPIPSDFGGNSSLNPQPLPPRLSIPSNWGAASMFR